MASSTNKMEADQALTNRSIPHRRVCGASRSKDLIDSKRGGKLTISEASAIFFKSEEVETGGGFGNSCSTTLGLEDTARRTTTLKQIRPGVFTRVDFLGQDLQIGLQFRFIFEIFWFRFLSLIFFLFLLLSSDLKSSLQTFYVTF